MPQPPIVISHTIQEYAGLRWYLCGRYFQREKDGRLHRRVWLDAHPGEPIPKGYDIHHKDVDRHNNHPDNLELKHQGAHRGEHSANPTPAQRAARSRNSRAASAGNKLIPREQRAAAAAAGWEKIAPVEVKCQECGEPFLTKSPATAQYCGGTCRARVWRARHWG